MDCDDELKKWFYEQANLHISSLNIRFREKCVIKEAMKNKIMNCLRENAITTDDFDSRFTSWCRNSFMVCDIGSERFLCDMKSKKPVLLYENMYEVYKKIHIETAHAGRDKCLDALSINYSWFNRELLQICLKSCSSCQQRKSIKRPTVSKPIIALEFMTRVQMDLIDMRTRPDMNPNGKTYKWILQLKDHFSKYCWGRALQKKEAREVYDCVREIFFQFGPPHILQSDNGREFVNELINSLEADFPGMNIVHGRPRHPQTQGLIERANAILSDALGKCYQKEISR
ncbi:unnamed protein product [Adineta ricciae]|uniref:Integrase catalytic domain-containing protein n=1 Tax=Adineta ricciae TaxID=249248 RepID=A0A814BL23_ADIRI|nr:unnamed protein product [Adineta ricciae]